MKSFFDRLPFSSFVHGLLIFKHPNPPVFRFLFFHLLTFKIHMSSSFYILIFPLLPCIHVISFKKKKNDSQFRNPKITHLQPRAKTHLFVSFYLKDEFFGPKSHTIKSSVFLLHTLICIGMECERKTRFLFLLWGFKKT